jgi:adenylate cyclase
MTSRVRRALLLVDMVESVRLISAHELDVIARWRTFVRLAQARVIAPLDGHLAKSLGDGLLIDFSDIHTATQAAFALHKLVESINVDVQPECTIMLRAAVHVADVVVDEHDIYGAGVNLAARLASLANPGDVIASEEARSQLSAGVDAEVEDLGSVFLKNLEAPVRAYRCTTVGGQYHLGTQLHVSPPQAVRPTLAVLSFVHSGDALDGAGAGTTANADLGHMLADEFSRFASAQGSVDVLSRLSTRETSTAYESLHTRNLRRLQLLRAQYAITGSTTSVRGRLRLVVEMVDVVRNHVVWSGGRTMSVINAIEDPQSQIELLAAAALSALHADVARSAHGKPIASIETYSLLSSGIQMMHRPSRDAFMGAYSLIEAAADRVPRHPDPLAWLSKWHCLQSYQGWSPDSEKSLARADDAARRALDRDESCALAWTVNAMVKTYAARRLDEALPLFEKALQFNPCEPFAWMLKGALHAFRDEGKQAVDATQRALHLSPLDPLRYYFDTVAASALATAGDYEGAILLAKRSLRANATHLSTLRVLIIAHTMLDRVTHAEQYVTQLRQLDPGFGVGRFLARSPGAESQVGRRFADALLRAGIPQ